MRSLDLTENTEDVQQTNEKELISLIPNVLKELEKIGKRDILNKE